MEQTTDPDYALVCEGIINIFAEELRKIFAREDKDPKYMNKTWLGCRFRAWFAILVAFNKSFGRMVKVLALAIAKHRQEKHGENKLRTQISLEKKMSEQDIATASSRAWNT